MDSKWLASVVDIVVGGKIEWKDVGGKTGWMDVGGKIGWMDVGVKIGWRWSICLLLWKV